LNRTSTRPHTSMGCDFHSGGAAYEYNHHYNASGAALGGGLYVDVSPTQLIQGSVIANNRVYSIAEAGTGGGVQATNDPIAEAVGGNIRPPNGARPLR
jgi:hypothetical protein